MTTLTAVETAKRLGIKLNTVYAYVSRGLLARQHAPDGSSRFDSRQVDALARRGRPRVSTQQASINLLIETNLTQISDSGVTYRGYAAKELIRTHTFEEVAELLWLGELQQSPHPWQGTTIKTPEVALAQQLQAIVACMPSGQARPGGSVPDASDAAALGRELIASVVDSLPTLAPSSGRPKLRIGDRAVSNSIAARLWPKLSPRNATPQFVALLNTTLILLADHELATSTLAVRVAASTHAHPAAVISAGIGAMQGPLHGGASRLARLLLEDAHHIGAHAAVAQQLQAKNRLHGFGHKVYIEADPRAVLLLDALRVMNPRARAVVLADDMCAEVFAAKGMYLNVDLAFAALELATDMPAGAGETIFTIARMAGWLGHAIEEYQEPPLRFRARARYVGR
jgi:citrate synthase